MAVFVSAHPCKSCAGRRTRKESWHNGTRTNSRKTSTGKRTSR